jgi:serine protease AprX
MTFEPNTDPTEDPSETSVIGADSKMYRRFYSGATSWKAFEQLDPGVPLMCEAVSVSRPGANSIDYFLVGTNHTLYFRTWDGTKWAGNWTAIAGQVLGPPAAVSKDGKRFIDVAFIGTDHALKWKKYEDGVWTPAGTDATDWGGKYLYNTASACSFGEKHVSFFCIGERYSNPLDLVTFRVQV